MKIICEKEKLTEGLNIVRNAVPSKTSFNVLECILIDARGDKIKLISNNMELGIETVIEGEIIDKGMAAIKSKKLCDIIRTMPDTKITIDVDKNGESITANISAFKATFNVSCDNPEEFTFLPYIEKNKYIEISQYDLKEMIRQTMFSMYSVDNLFKELKGELFEIRDNELIIVSSDRERISERRIKINDAENVRVIIPANTIREIYKILPADTQNKVKIYITSSHILFEYGETVVVSRLVEGKFFDVEKIKGKTHETKIKINRNVFISCLERASIIIRDQKVEPVIIDVKDESMRIKIKSSLDEMDEEIEVNKEGQDMILAFNPNFISDVLKVIDDEEITMYLSSQNTISYIKNEEETYNYQIMPSRF